MRRLAIIAIALLATIAADAQQSPVHWSYSILKKSAQQYEVHLKATMDADWHIYACEQPASAIAQPTNISFAANSSLVFKGNPKEVGRKEIYTDQNAGIQQYYFGGMVEYIQYVQRKDTTTATISGTVTYQPCTNERCLAPRTETFSLPVK